MNNQKLKLRELSDLELRNIDGGNPAAIAAAVYAVALAATMYVGYQHGKEDCPPPPCK